MIKRKVAFFSVGVLSLMIPWYSATADIAAKSYVDQEVGKKLTAVTSNTTGSGNVVSAVSATGGTITATKGITAEEVSNKVNTIRDSAAATDIAYPSEKAVATALEGKADSADLSDLATKAELENYATTESLATVATTGSYNDLSDKPVIPEGVVVDEVITAEGVNPVQGKAVYEALAGKQPVGDYATNTALSSVQATAESAQDDATDAMQAVDGKVSKSQGTGAANKALVTDASGNVTAGTISSAMITDGTITNADISSSAAIDQSKISGLTTALAGKANTEDLAEVATTGSYNDLTDKPSIPAAITVDTALSSTSTNPVQNKVINTALAGKLSTTGTAAKATADANGNNIVDTYATKTQLSSYVTTTTLNGLDSTSSGTGAVVTGVSQTNGKVAVTKGNVKIPVGSESATTYATIWIE